MHHYACAILLRDGDILLGKRSPHRRAYPNCWDIIGGRVETEETLEAALARELDEELGVRPIHFEKFAEIKDSNPGGRGEAVYKLFVVKSWLGEPEMKNGEHSELRWFPIESACALRDLALTEYPDLFRRIR